MTGGVAELPVRAVITPFQRRRQLDGTAATPIPPTAPDPGPEESRK